MKSKILFSLTIVSMLALCFSAAMHADEQVKTEEESLVESANQVVKAIG